MCFYFQQSYSNIDTQLFEPHQSLVDDYRRYMGELGCLTPLCDDEENQNNMTFIYNNNSSNVNNTNCCSICSCSDNCLRDGNCCPDKLTEEFIMNSIYPVGGMFYCESIEIKDEPDITGAKFKVINKCIRTFDEPDVMEKCTNPDATKLENYRIVSHKNTHEAYKNIHCAKCNNFTDEDFVPWAIKVNCRQGIFLPNSMSDIVSEIRRSDDCNIVFDPPKGFRQKFCEPMISKCNETGLLRTNESLVLEEACDAFVFEFKSGNETYKNTFCYICNKVDALEHKCPTHEEDGHGHSPFVPDLKMSFTALLDFTESPTNPESMKCDVNAVFDQYKVKRNKQYRKTIWCINKTIHQDNMTVN